MAKKTGSQRTEMKMENSTRQERLALTKKNKHVWKSAYVIKGGYLQYRISRSRNAGLKFGVPKK